jgi:P pilus assembly chaperone PapD
VKKLIKASNKKHIIRKYVVKATALVLSVLVVAIMMMPLPVLAVSVAVNPGRITIDITESNVATLDVINNGNSSYYYRVYTTEELSQGYIAIEPQEFMLAPRQTEKVSITIAPSIDNMTGSRIYIYVVSTGENSGLQIGAGIKVPVYINN